MNVRFSVVLTFDLVKNYSKKSGGESPISNLKKSE